MNKKGFTLIELLAVIIVLAIIMVLTIPNVLSTMSKAKDEALITYAKKVRKVGQEYAFVHQEEFTSEAYIEKNLDEIMSDNGNYTGEVLIYKDGKVDIIEITSNDNRAICNTSYDSNITISTKCTSTPFE